MKCFNCSISVSYVLISVCLLCASVHDDMCSKHVNGYYGKEAILDCCFQSDYGVYWYEETDEEPFIRLESGVKSGRGYDSNEYDVLQNGSLVIKNVQLKHEQEYKVISLDSELRNQIFLVTFSVVENYCPSQVSGLYGEEGMISCYFRPNFQTIIWFDETSTREPLIRLEHNAKSGRGYDSGKYDVLQNGSLIINTIEFINEQQYITVAVIFGSTNITEFSIVFFVIGVTHSSGRNLFRNVCLTFISEHCPTQQSGFSGEKGNIICHFKPNFNKVSWYLEQDKPLIQLEGYHISGQGYENEKYSVKQNGSLVIRRVTEENEAHYRVILLDANNISTAHRVEFKLETGCWGRQYGYCGKKGIINCNFEPGYGDVYWYDDTIDFISIIRLESGVKSGRGYNSNEYDVLQNGSLVIKNVQHKHEREYKVIRYDGEHQIIEYRITFSVIVFAENHCASPQHGYLGKEGIISCNIQQGIDVYWYNETNEYHHPFIKILESGDIIGSGYKSMEYDILQNGSLVIRNVQYKHQQSYQVTFQIGSQVDLRVEFSVIVPTTSNSGNTLPSEVTSIVQSTKVETDNSRSVTTEPQFTTAYTTETTKPEDSDRGYLHLIWIVVVAAVVAAVVVLVVIKIKASCCTVKKKEKKEKVKKENNEEGHEMLNKNS